MSEEKKLKLFKGILLTIVLAVFVVIGSWANNYENENYQARVDDFAVHTIK